MKILIVEDEKFLAESIQEYLKKQYQTEIAQDFESAKEKVLNYDYDCILLDITLPDGNGLNILKILKEENKTEGIIIISAKNSLDDKILGLELGADDYLPKPFHLSELSARISSVIRRRNFDGNNVLKINDLDIDAVAKTVKFKHQFLDLTRTEFDLLAFLISNKNKVVSKSAIAEHISGDQAEFFDNFDFIYAHIKNLKKKITNSGARDFLKSVYGMGYKYEVF
ncbi:response regulator transcription factor [Kaistella montana]|uniref:Response regulator transcription factor n=1 Tax=Kaistella montana TaxID=1849733 RepID=A0ABW5K8F6_9FLAO|nr:response regulator transcription factor [Kaistella montana]MCQ4035500.1 response regulator transcription factor [Kaistella montana]